MEEKNNNLVKKIAYELVTTVIAVLIIMLFMLFVIKRNFAQAPNGGMSQAPLVGMNEQMERAFGIVF